MTMTSLKLPKGKRNDEQYPIADDYPREEYPYCTRIELENASLDALGIKELPEVGSVLMMECKVKVIGARQSANSTKTTRILELQITDMDLELDEDEVSEGELTRGDSKSMNNLAKKMKSM